MGVKCILSLDDLPFLSSAPILPFLLPLPLLLPSSLFILYVEGPTEKNTLEDWLKHQYYGNLITIISMDTTNDLSAISRVALEKIKDREYFFPF